MQKLKGEKHKRLAASDTTLPLQFDARLQIFFILFVRDESRVVTAKSE